jgi:hypothetical protein
MPGESMLDEQMNFRLERGEKARHDKRYFHLTPQGWVRQDSLPFPRDRVETWVYETHRIETQPPGEEAEVELRLSRLWSDAGVTAGARDALRARFGRMAAPRPDRNR